MNLNKYLDEAMIRIRNLAARTKGWPVETEACRNVLEKKIIRRPKGKEISDVINEYIDYLEREVKEYIEEWGTLEERKSKNGLLK